MSNAFIQQLCEAQRPFLAGFGRACLDQGLSDEAAYGCLKRAAAAFPAVREELVSFQKGAFIGPALNFGTKAVAALGPKLTGAAKLVSGVATPGRVQAGSTLLGGGLGALHGYQEGGFTGAATEGTLGAVAGRAGAAGGLRGGLMGSMTTPLTSGTMAQAGLPSPGGLAGGVVGAGQRFMGVGAPTFKSQIDPNVKDFNQLQQQLGQGMEEVNQAGKQWQDNRWSGGNYQKAIQSQRDKLYQGFRDRAGAMKADPASIEGTLGNYTPQVASSDPNQMWQTLQDPESRKMFQPHMEQAENELLTQAQAKQPIDTVKAKNVLMQRAAFTAAEKGIKPDELIADAHNTVQELTENGGTPETVQKLFQGKGGQELAQKLIDEGQVKGPGDYMRAAAAWATENPVDAGTLLLGGTLALGGLYSAMTGGGMGAWMAMLGGGAMAAAGSGMFGDTGMGKAIGGMFGVQNQGTSLMDVMNGPKPGGTPGVIPVMSSEAPAANSMAQHYGQQVMTPEGARALHAALLRDPPTEQLAKEVLKTPEALQQFIAAYNKNPIQAKQFLHSNLPGFDPFRQGPAALEKHWPALQKHLNGPYQAPAE